MESNRVWMSENASSISIYEQDYSQIRYLTETPFKRSLEPIEAHVIDVHMA